MPAFYGNKLVCAVSAAALCFGLTSCSGQQTQTPHQPTPQVVQEDKTPEPPETTGEQNPSAFTAPLTGLPVEASVQERPLAIMINNAPAARPQAGLSEADMVYEVLAEGGITRLVAFFQSKGGDVKIGPVRSIRPYLIELGEMYGAVMVHAGGSTDAYAILQQQKKEHLDEISNAGAYFWRSKDRKAPHNLYTDVDKLRAGSDKRGYDKQKAVPTYTYLTTDDPALQGEPMTDIDIRFLLKSYHVSYTYDTSNKLYKRSINGKAHIDQNTNQQLATANVIVMRAKQHVLDDVGRLDVELEGQGEALVFQHGQRIRAQWMHTPGDSIRFKKDGIEIPLVPGTSYIHVVPADGPIDEHVK